MANYAIFKGRREVKTYVDLFHGSEILLQKSVDDKRGSYFTTMGSLLLTAFTFESFLNHLGSKKIKFWDEIERISVFSKYKVLCKELKIKPDFSKSPYQIIKQLFNFRNAIAHGRSTILKVAKEVPVKDEPWNHVPKTDWEEFCTEKNAVRSREDIKKIIIELYETAKLGECPFISGITTSYITLKGV